MGSFQEAISQSNFQAASDLLAEGAKWDLNGFMERQAIANIIRGEGFDLLATLFEKEIISPDIFEYDNFDGTAFEALTNAPCTDALLEFMENFAPEVENIDDDIGGKTWLSLALSAKADPRFIDILTGAGCDINRINTREQNYLFSTQDLELTEYLINQGLDVNKKGIDGRSPLFGAVKSKNMDLIQLYLDNGAETNLQDNKGETVYNMVCFVLVDPEVFEALAAIEPPRHDLQNSSNQSLLMQYALSSIEWDNAVKLLECLINSGGNIWENSVDSYGRAMTPADALAKKDESILSMLIEQDGFDAAALDDRGNNWLHKVCKENLNFDAQKAKAFYKKVKTLLKAGVDPTLKNDEDKSPMDYAQDDNLKSKALEIMMKAGS